MQQRRAKAMHGKNGLEMKAMLSAKQVDFEEYPVAFRRGVFLRRITVERPLNAEELARVPEQHRPPAGTLFQRSNVVVLQMPPFNLVANRGAVIFDGAEPQKLQT